MVYGNIAPSISNNTISQNTIGVYLDGDARYLTIKNNNIQDNSKYSIHLSSVQDLNATYNWWGTTDVQAINQTIYDFKNDFNLGKVNFVPFLTESNPQAPAIPTSTTTPPPTGSPTPTPPNMGPTSPPTSKPALTPEQLEAIVGAVIVAIVVGAAVGLLIYLIKKK